mgnify:CR=1 FL=1
MWARTSAAAQAALSAQVSLPRPFLACLKANESTSSAWPQVRALYQPTALRGQDAMFVPFLRNLHFLTVAQVLAVETRLETLLCSEHCMLAVS